MVNQWVIQFHFDGSYVHQSMQRNLLHGSTSWMVLGSMKNITIFCSFKIFIMFFNHTNGVKMSHSIPIFRYTQQLTMGMVNRGNDLLLRDMVKEISDGFFVVWRSRTKFLNWLKSWLIWVFLKVNVCLCLYFGICLWI